MAKIGIKEILGIAAAAGRHVVEGMYGSSHAADQAKSDLVAKLGGIASASGPLDYSSVVDKLTARDISELAPEQIRAVFALGFADSAVTTTRGILGGEKHQILTSAEQKLAKTVSDKGAVLTSLGNIPEIQAIVAKAKKA